MYNRPRAMPELPDETPENTAEANPYDWPTFTFADRP